MKTVWQGVLASVLLAVLNSGWAGLPEGQAAFDRQDYAKALAEFKPLALRGNAKAQFGLGLMHDDGLGVTQSASEAAQWYRKAAAQGHAAAQFNLGVATQRGEGVPANPTEAVKWFRLAAQQGQPNAQLNLGQAYFLGLGVAQNQAEAIRWYRKAAAQGNANAQFNLGVAHYAGQGGLPVNHTQAFAWYLKAAQQGHAKAISNLGALFNDQPTVPRHALFSMSANLDPSPANVANGHRAKLAGSLSPQELAAAQALVQELETSSDFAKTLQAQLDQAAKANIKPGKS